MTNFWVSGSVRSVWQQQPVWLAARYPTACLAINMLKLSGQPHGILFFFYKCMCRVLCFESDQAFYSRHRVSQYRVRINMFTVKCSRKFCGRFAVVSTRITCYKHGVLYGGYKHMNFFINMPITHTHVSNRIIYNTFSCNNNNLICTHTHTVDYKKFGTWEFNWIGRRSVRLFLEFFFVSRVCVTGC